MSLAGVRSSQGDAFQTLIAVRYAIQMLSNHEISAVEVDSTSLDASGEPFLIDDVVVRRSEGNLLIQAKKNQPDFRAWSISDLQEELGKAWTQFRREPGARILFVSRNDFGEAAKLAAHARTQPTARAFEKSMSGSQRDIALRLMRADPDGLGDTDELYALLLAIAFETVNPETERELLIGSLGQHVASAELAFRLMFGHMDAIGRREEFERSVRIPTHALTRKALLELLSEAGIEIGQPKAVSQLISGLAQVSEIGRAWTRTVGRSKIQRPEVRDVLEAIAAGESPVLLAAGPGVGKTCLLLDLQEALEQDANVTSVFIQAREFASSKTAADRAAIGLPQDFVSDVARLSETRRVIVLLDSLDVLSLSRDSLGLSFFLSLFDRLRKIPNVSVVAACRSFDLQYDGRLSERDWGTVIEIKDLDWDEIVKPLLIDWGVDPNDITSSLKDLLRNPRHLAVFFEIAKRGGVPPAATAQELSECYLERVVLSAPGLGEEALKSLQRFADWMLKQRRLDVPRGGPGVSQPVVRALMSEGILIKTTQQGVAFAHQTLLDVLAVAHAKASGETLAEFIRTQAAAPFIRPTVRAYLFSLRVGDSTQFLRQVREVVDAKEIAFHLKRLVVESIAGVDPLQSDWPLVRHLYKKHPALFAFFYEDAASDAWHQFLETHWLPEIMDEKDGPWLVRFLERLAANRCSVHTFIACWQKALECEWVNQDSLWWISARILDKFQTWTAPGIRDVLKKLVSDQREDHGSLGGPLSRYVEATNSNDDILWEYISRRVSEDTDIGNGLGQALECDQHVFKEGFLKQRLVASENLINCVVTSVEEWAQRYKSQLGFRSSAFLDKTTYGLLHSSSDMRHVDAVVVLMRALEQACVEHAKAQTNWWRKTSGGLCSSAESALAYIAIKAMTESPANSVNEAIELLCNENLLDSSEFTWELGNLLRAVAPKLSYAQIDRIQDFILDFGVAEGNGDAWLLELKRSFLCQLPRYALNEHALRVVADAEREFGPYSSFPEIRSWGGWVRSPVSAQRIAQMSDAGLLRLTNHYAVVGGRVHSQVASEHLVGGLDMIVREISEAASLRPERFLSWLRVNRREIPTSVPVAVVEGVARHLRMRFGNLQSGNNWTPIESPEPELLWTMLVDELELHHSFWMGRREAAEVLLACADVSDDHGRAERLAFLAFPLLASRDPSPERTDKNSASVALNSTRGTAVEAVVKLAGNLLERGDSLPVLVKQLLLRGSVDTHPSIRSHFLRLLPRILHFDSQLGWSLFDRLMAAEDRPWGDAYNCLYFNYRQNPSKVKSCLDLMLQDGSPDALVVWGRIEALRALTGASDLVVYLETLAELSSEAAWKGAADVFATNLGEGEVSPKCSIGLAAAFESLEDLDPLVDRFSRIFYEQKGKTATFELSLLKTFFRALSTKASGRRVRRGSYGFGEWLAPIAVSNADYAIAAAEMVLSSCQDELDIWDGDAYARTLTALFREAEERELSDGGDLLRRTIFVQDQLLRRGMRSLDSWLRLAERP